jgi:hypothetical protein
MRGVAIVPAGLDGFIATNRFFVVSNNPDKILLDYVRFHFCKPEILALLKRECSGEINPGLAWPAFEALRIPLPPVEVQNRILNTIKDIEGKKKAIFDGIAKLDNDIDKEVRSVLPYVFRNYDDVKIERAEFIGDADLKGFKNN